MPDLNVLGEAFRYQECNATPPSTQNTSPTSPTPPSTPWYQVQFTPNSMSTMTPMDSPPEAPPVELSSGKSRIPKEKRFYDALEVLRQGRLGLIDLLLHVLDSTIANNHRSRQGLLGDKIFDVFDKIVEFPEGKSKMQTWMRGPGFEIITSIIEDEMDSLKEKFRLPAAAMTPTYIDRWSFGSAIGHLTQQYAPFLTQILMQAGQDKVARAKNKKKTPEIVCQIIISQLTYSRSFHTCGFQAIFSLFLWTTGCQRQTIDALYRCGLSLSYDTILSRVASLGDNCLALAKEISTHPHALCWDNFDTQTSIFVEQRTDGPSKVQSGTFAVLYKLKNVDPSKMELAPILARKKSAPGLDFDQHIKPTFEQLESTLFQMQVIVVRVLTTYSEHFKDLANSPELQHKPRYPLPLEKTETFPLRVTTLNEATIAGTIQIWQNVYEEQLGRTHKQMENIAVPSFNDQLTNARIRGARSLRLQDINPFLRLENIQLGYGAFHKCLNLVWAILKIHQGTIRQLGSLKYFFALLEKTRLANDKPDYHTLLSALFQILNGILLQAWRHECGFTTLKLFAESKPTPQDLLRIAQRIIRNHATAMEELPPPKKGKKKTKEDEPSPIEALPPSKKGQENTEEDESSSSSEESDEGEDGSARPLPAADPPLPADNPQMDRGRRNIRLLVRDLLYVAELVRAISDGDWGRVEDIIGQLTMMFRGAGSNNYSTELLHFIHNLKLVWGDDFANIMRGCMLVNPSGLEGHWMGIDMNIEHFIGYLKFLFSSKGLYAGWDTLGNISAAIEYLQKIKKQVGLALRGYRGSSHTTPDTSSLVWKVANNVKEAELLLFKIHHEHHPNSDAKSVLNLLDEGEKKLRSSSLKTFNKKIHALNEGYDTSSFEEVDELSGPDFRTVIEEDEGENSNNVEEE